LFNVNYEFYADDIPLVSTLTPLQENIFYANFGICNCILHYLKKNVSYAAVFRYCNILALFIIWYFKKIRTTLQYNRLQQKQRE